MVEENSEKKIADLTGFLNQVVTVTSKDGRQFRGKLVSYDEYMNLILEEAESNDKHYKLLVLKGGNVSDISI